MAISDLDNLSDRLKLVQGVLSDDKKINDYQLTESKLQEYQIYFIGHQFESIRTAKNRRLSADIFHDHKGGRGDTNIVIDGDRPQDIKGQIVQALDIAKLTGNPYFPLPGKCDYPDIATHDPKSVEIGALNDFLAEMNKAIKKEKGIKISSAELFARDGQISFVNSTGAVGSRKETRISLELVLLDDESRVECYGSRVRRRLCDFAIDNFVALQAKYTRDATGARPPRSGQRPIVFVDKALDNVFSPLIAKTSAQAFYNQHTQLKSGMNLIAPENIKGDRITMYSDATFDFGMASYAFDGQGIPGACHTIIKEGTVQNLWADARYAHYLKIPYTGTFGNLVIEPGHISEKELWADPDALIVTAFSSFVPDSFTGHFASEIKMGYEMKNGKLSPVRGGSVTGNLLDFSDITLAKERYFLSHMHIPIAIRYGKMTVSGQ